MISNVLSELRNNPRLRWGIALIVGTCWLYGILLLSETLQAQTLRHRTLAQSVSRLQAQLAQTEWLQRVAPAKNLAVQLEGRLWQASTLGLAQAAFQEWLSVNANQAGATRSQITVTPVLDATLTQTDQATDTKTMSTTGSTPAGLWKITAKLSFESPAPILLNLLNQIEGNDKKVIVTSLNVRKEPTPRVEMELSSYFQKQYIAAATDDKAKSASKASPK
jgi:hypothetical protein